MKNVDFFHIYENVRKKMDTKSKIVWCRWWNLANHAMKHRTKQTLANKRLPFYTDIY